jgi:hypothetical protein
MLGFGPSYGFSTLVWIVAIIIVAGIIWRGRKNYVPGALMVLTRFRINEDPSAKVCVEISGRASGVVSWILTLLRLKPEVEFVVTDSEVSIRTASLSGIQHVCIPLGKITATICGYQRSIWALGFAILFSVGFVLNLLSGFLGSNQNEIILDITRAFGSLIWATIAALVYFLSKRIAIIAESMHAHGVVFKRSVIENVSVDLPQALKAISVINGRLLAAQAMTKVEYLTVSAATGNGAGVCPKCSSLNAVGTRFCENCGSPLPE